MKAMPCLRWSGCCFILKQLFAGLRKGGSGLDQEDSVHFRPTDVSVGLLYTAAFRSFFSYHTLHFDLLYGFIGCLSPLKSAQFT